MKIALIGTRGVPANYGGFETCVEEVGRRLAARGHAVTVYCRERSPRERAGSYLGMNLVHLPCLRRKALETLTHTFLSMLHALFSSYDILMVFNAANSPTMVLPRLLGRRMAINTDGLEWKRGKWGPVARNYYKVSEWLSTKVADRIVADSPGIQQYYLREYAAESTYIAYGAYVDKSRQPRLLETLGVKPGEYFLQITRFEPENNPLLAVRAFNRVNSGKKLVLVGGVPYSTAYSEAVKDEAGPGVILPGPVYDRDLLTELWCNCFAYIHGNEVGGTNPALLQAMASGCFTLSVDVEFNRHVLRDGGRYFLKTEESLAEGMRWALTHGEQLPDYKKRAIKRIEENYSWDKIASQYEELFLEILQTA